MFRKISTILVFSMLALQLSPSLALSWHAPQPRYGYQRNYVYRGHDFGHHRNYGYRYSHHYHDVDDAVFWGVTGLLLGTIVLASALPPPPSPPPVVYYSTPPQQQVYSYPPYVPPGMCRWERYIIDGYGRMVMDRNGQPVREYTLGSCQYPPN